MHARVAGTLVCRHFDGALLAPLLLPLLTRLMDIDGADAHKDNGTQKKTAAQLQSLENFYAEEKYPKKNKMEEYASTLDLTYKQVRIWFSERRKEKRIFGASQAKSNPNCFGHFRALTLPEFH